MKKKKILLMIMSAVLILTIGFTYAYFSAEVEGEGTDSMVETGVLSLHYTDGQEIVLNHAQPGNTITKIVSVENTGTLETSYTVYLTQLINTITNDELVISATCSSVITDEEGNTVDGTCNNIDETIILNSETETIQPIVESLEILPGEKHTYNLTILFKEISSAQNYNQGKSFSTLIQIEEANANSNPVVYWTESCTPESDHINCRIIYDNTPYSDDIASPNVTSENGIDFAIPSDTSNKYTIVDSGVTETITLSNTSSSFYYGTDIYVENSTGNLAVSNYSYNSYSENYADVVGKYICPTRRTSSCAEMYLVDSSTEDTITGRKFTSTLSETINNGTGLYYTDKLNEVDENNNNVVDSPIYYYRGNVENNYVLFGGFCWRIIRTNEDGSVRLRYNGTPTDGACPQKGGETYITISDGSTSYGYNMVANDDTSLALASHVGYTFGTDLNTNNIGMYGTTDSEVKKEIDLWYQNNLLTNADKISNAVYCNDRTYKIGYNNRIYYGAGYRLSDYNYLRSSGTPGTVTPQFACPDLEKDGYTLSGSEYGNGLLTYPVALLTADEASYAGAVHGVNNTNSYIYTSSYYFTMSPHYSPGDALSYVYTVYRGTGRLHSNQVIGYTTYVPVISIYGDNIVQEGTTGAYNNPYTIQ